MPGYSERDQFLIHMLRAIESFREANVSGSEGQAIEAVAAFGQYLDLYLAKVWMPDVT